uniref:SEC7 domain-containing protein n=1 Tax=Romanomermis culicivorax TaxID=13658 RepID=A0A915IFC5_ROMCU
MYGLPLCQTENALNSLKNLAHVGKRYLKYSFSNAKEYQNLKFSSGAKSRKWSSIFMSKKPDRGIEFLIGWGFVENSPTAVAKFLVTRKGLSRQMIGEYLGNLQKSFNQQVLRFFAEEVDMKNFEIDVALRKFQAKFRLPGEAQKIERIVEVFANRYCQCNLDFTSKFKQKDTVFVLAFAIIMLNTDLHSPNVKASRRMKVEDFVKNLKGIDADSDIDTKLLTDIYHRVKQSEFRSDADHVTQVLRVEQCLVGKKPIHNSEIKKP